MDDDVRPVAIQSGQRYLATIGGSSVEVSADFTSDGRTWLCRDRKGQFFVVKTDDLRPPTPSTSGKSDCC